MDFPNRRIPIHVVRIAGMSIFGFLFLWRPTWTRSEILPQVQRLETGAARIAGIALDAETGGPALETLVTLSGGATSRRVTVDSEGRFAFDMVVPGRYELIPAKPGHSFWHPNSGIVGQKGRSIVITSAAETLRDLELQIARLGVVTGRLIHANGSPASSTRVVLQRRIYWEDGSLTFAKTDPLRAAMSDDRGQYRIFDVEPGEYFVAVEGAPLSFRTGSFFQTSYYPGVADRSAALPVILRPGEELHLKDIVKTPTVGTTVRLHFADLDTSASPLVRELRLGDLGAEAEPLPGEDPSVLTISSVPPGRFEAVVFWPTKKGKAYALIDTNIGASPMDLTLLPQLANRVAIRVLTRGSQGKPDVTTEVTCIVLIPGSLRQLGQSQSCSRAETTAFEIPDDRYRIALRGIPSSTRIFELRGPNGEVLKNGIEVHGSGTFQVVLRDDLSAKVSGVVREANGALVSNAVLALVPDEPSRSLDHLYRTAISDVGGRFELDAIVPGTYHLFAWRQLNGAAYKNEEFMKPFESDGIPLTISDNQHIKTEVVPLVDNRKN